MTSARLSTLLLIAAAILSIRGQNATVSPTAGNFSSLAILTTTTSAVPKTQRTTELPTNTTQKTTAVPGIKKGECYGFEVFVMNNQLNIPYTVACCITVLCGFYLVLFGKIDCYLSTLHAILLALKGWFQKRIEIVLLYKIIVFLVHFFTWTDFEMYCTCIYNLHMTLSNHVHPRQAMHLKYKMGPVLRRVYEMIW